MAKYLPHFPLYLPSQGPFPGADRDSYNESRYWLNREICNSFSPIFTGSGARMATFCSHQSLLLGRRSVPLAAH